ncbi:MAG TPA: mersacidin/lichenicidin family type 2 lantibiotic [Ktedonobacterales bacterium]|jgi:mersacidin/lichenicidin family type 2 lantibiotic
MTKADMVRAWKDAEYRQNLSAEEQTLLPEHPAGSIELTDADLPQVAGGAGAFGLTYVSRCDLCTFDYFCPPQTLTLTE